MVKVLIEQDINIDEYDRQVQMLEDLKKDVDKDDKIIDKKAEKQAIDIAIQCRKDDKARILRKGEAYQKFLKGEKIDFKLVLEQEVIIALSYNNWKSIAIVTSKTGGTVFTDITDKTAFDYFENAFAVNDAIYFGAGDWGGTLIQNLRFDVGTAIAATSYSGVWEYYKTGVGWTTLTVTDNTSGFSITGQNTVTWTQDDIEGWVEHSSTGLGRAHWLRYRITAVDTPTEGGANATTECVGGDNMYNINAATVSVTDMITLGTAEKAMLRVQPTNNKGFIIRAHINFDRDGASAPIWQENTENRTITIVCPAVGRHVYTWKSTGTTHMGQLIFGKKETGNITRYGVNYQEENSGSIYGAFNNHGGAEEKYYGSRIRISKSYGAGNLNEAIASVIDTPQRYNPIVFVKNINFVEPSRLEGSLQDSLITNVSAQQQTLFYGQSWVRCVVHNNSIRKSFGNGHTFLIDNINSGTYENHLGSWDRDIFEMYSIYLRVTDTLGAAIAGATVTLKDKDGKATFQDLGRYTDTDNGGGFTFTTNDDGYVGWFHGTATGGGADYIDDSGQTFGGADSWVAYRSGWTILITSGTGAGQYRTIKNTASNSNTRLYVTENWATNPDATSKYVVVPTCIRKQWYYNGATNTNITFQPFTLEISKTGYDTVKLLDSKDITAEFGTRWQPIIVILNKPSGIGSAYIG